MGIYPTFLMYIVDYDRDVPSPYLFIIMVVDLLSNMIRVNQNIEGIKLGNCISKIHQYANDTFVTIHNNAKSVDNLFNIIK